MFYFWFVLFVVLLALEIATINLVSIWFAIGALVTALCTYLTDSVTIQLVIFCFVSLIALILTRPVMRRFTKGKKVATNTDRVIGQVAVVTEDIIPLQIGEVKVDGKRWSAVAKEEIKKGQKVIVLTIDGVKLLVASVKEGGES